MNQYVTADRVCRRCRRPMDLPEVDPQLAAAPLPLPFSHPPDMCILFSFELSFPIVVYWMRTSRGISQSQLAERMGIDRQVISLYENAKRLPNAATVEKIAGALGVSTSRMMRCCEYLRNGQ